MYLLEGGEETGMSLSDRVKVALVLDHGTFFSRTSSHSSHDWADMQSVLKGLCEKCHAQCEARDRDSSISSQEKQKCAGADYDDEGDLSIKEEDGIRWTLAREDPMGALALERRLPEEGKRHKMWKHLEVIIVEQCQIR